MVYGRDQGGDQIHAPWFTKKNYKIIMHCKGTCEKAEI